MDATYLGFEPHFNQQDVLLRGLHVRSFLAVGNVCSQTLAPTDQIETHNSRPSSVAGRMLGRYISPVDLGVFQK